MDILNIEDLVKSYNGVPAVKGISFSVPEGSKLAFLGPNGAGKSTTISILCALLKADSGRISVCGTDISDPKVKDSIGVVFQESLLDKGLTVKENLELALAIRCYPRDSVEKRISEISTMTGIGGFLDKLYGSLSGGQKRRVDIARAIIHGPRILFLDEPSTGLDPKSRTELHEMLNDLNASGITIFLTTHYMEEAVGMDRIIIMNRGRILVDDTPDRIKDRYTNDRLVLFSEDPITDILDENRIKYRSENGSVVVDLENTMSSLDILELVKHRISSFEVIMGTLDDAFINIIEGDSE